MKEHGPRIVAGFMEEDTSPAAIADHAAYGEVRVAGIMERVEHGKRRVPLIRRLSQKDHLARNPFPLG